MSRWTYLILILVTTPFPAAVAQTGQVEGTVADSLTGAPVARARVTLARTNLSALTNENGYFTIPRIPVGVYLVRVAAPGYQPAAQSDSRVYDGMPSRLHFRLVPDLAGREPLVELEGQTDVTALTDDVLVLQPGFGVGGSVGIDGFGGGRSGPLGDGVGSEFFVHLVTRQGLSLHVGGHFSGHAIDQASPPYHLSTAFIEPRFVFLNISSRWAPFVLGRLGRDWEIVDGPRVKITASGHSVGGGGGVALRLAPQVTMETGMALGRVTFGAYTFKGDFAWKSCLDSLEDGTSLPESIVRCAGSRSLGGVADFCYPPYFPEPTSNCTPPDIPYPNSQRSAMWFRLWVGLKLSFATARDLQ